MATHAIQHLDITSPAFDQDGNIPSKYTCDGEGRNPSFNISNLPDGTRTLAIIAEDPDAPRGTFDHWIAWNINPVSVIEENSNPGTSGNNSSGKSGYYAPCPPSGVHRYYFHFYALDTKLDLAAGSGKNELKHAMRGHILSEGSLMGKYSRQ